MSNLHFAPSKRSALCLFIAISQFLVGLPAGAGDSHLATFSNGESEGQAVFGPGGGNLTPLQLTVPGEAIVLNASLSLEGLPSVLSGGLTDTSDADFSASEGQRNLTIAGGSVRLATGGGRWEQASDADLRTGRAENIEVQSGVRLARGAKYSIVVEDRALSPVYASQLHAAGAADSRGNFVLAWEDLRFGTSLDIYACIIDPSGTPGSDILVCGAAGHQFDPAVAVDSGDNFVVLWQDSRSGDSDIFGRKYDSLGAPAGAEFPVSNAADDQSRPAVCFGATGKILAAWDDYRGGRNYEVRTQMLNPDGTPDGGEHKLSTYPADQMAPSVCPVPGGYALVYQNSSNLTGADVEGYLLDAGGMPAGTFTVCNAAFNQSSARLARGPGGRFCAVWEDRRSGDNFDIRGRWFDSSGAPSGAEAAVCWAEGDQRYPAFSVLSSGEVLVAWEDERSGSADIYFKRFGSDWTPVGTEVSACSQKRDQDGAAAALMASGAMFIAWSDWRDGLPNIHFEKYANPRFVYSSGSLISPRIPAYAATYGSVGLCITLPRMSRARTDTTGYSLDILDGWDDILVQPNLLPGGHINIDPREHPSIRLALRMWTRDENVTPVLRRWSVGTSVEDDFDVANGGTFTGARARNGEVVLQSGRTLMTVTNDLPVKDGSTNSYDVQVAKFPEGDGSYVGVWKEGSGTGADILARKFSRDGTPLTSEVTVCNAPGQQDSPVVAVDQNGLITVAWVDNRSGTNCDIYARRFGPDGSPVGGEQIICGTGADQRLPRLASDLDNNLVVVWVDFGLVYATLYLQKYDSDGNPLHIPVRVSWSQLSLLQPAVATDSQNRILLAWVDFRNGNPDIFATIYKPDCTPVTTGKEFQICVKPGNQWAPSLAVDREDNFLIAWEDQFNPNDYNVYAKKFDPNGTGLTGELAIATRPSDQGRPSVAVDSTGRFMAAWHSIGDGYDIYGRYFNPDGSPAGDELTICNVKNVEGESADQTSPSVSCGPGDEFIVAWMDNRPKYDMDVWAKAYGFPVFLSTGSYLTPAYDLVHSPLSLDAAGWNATIPSGTSVIAFLRSSPDGSGWSAWEAVGREQAVLATAPDRYIQWQFNLASPVLVSTPVLHNLFLRYTTYATNGTLISPPLEVPFRISELVVCWNATLNGEYLAVEFTQDGGASWRGCTSGSPAGLDPLAATSVLRYRLFLHSNGSSTPVLEDIGLTFSASSYPTDPALDVGGDGVLEWTRAGPLNSTVEVGGLEKALNDLLVSFGNPARDVFVPLTLRSSTAGAIRVSNLSVLYNTPPVFRTALPAGDFLTIREGEHIDFTIEPVDRDGDDLDIVWTLNGRVVRSSLPDFSFQTDHDSSGSYDVKVIVSDQYFTINRSWQVLVSNLNRVPDLAWSPGTDLVLNETEKASFWVTVSDRDGDRVNITWYLDGASVSDQPSWEYLTDFNCSGTHFVMVRATDKDGAVFHNWTVTVLNKNRPPVITGAAPPAGGPVKAQKNRPVQFGVDAADPDGDALRYVWKVNDVTVPGEDRPNYTCRMALATGASTVRVEVTDGNSTVTQGWELKVTMPPEDGVTTGGFGFAGLAAVAVLVAAALAGAVLYLRRRKNRA